MHAQSHALLLNSSYLNEVIFFRCPLYIVLILTQRYVSAFQTYSIKIKKTNKIQRNQIVLLSYTPSSEPCTVELPCTTKFKNVNSTIWFYPHLFLILFSSIYNSLPASKTAPLVAAWHNFNPLPHYNKDPR